MKASLIVVCAAIASLYRGLAEPPPNDDFADATVLTGNDVTFPATLHDATVETNGGQNNREVSGDPFQLDYPQIARSVWWKWTAQQSSPVVVTLTSFSQDNYNDRPVMLVYSTTSDLNFDPNTGRPDFPKALASLNISPQILQSSFVFNATNGSNYQFQLMDRARRYAHPDNNPTYSLTFRLVATNAPVILQPPVSQTVNPGQSVLFTVLAEGVRPLHYQWRFNGTNLPRQNMTILSLTNIITARAGTYTVIVSNATGAVTSAPARLTVTSNIASSTGMALDPTAVSTDFRLPAEPGRYFRIMSSTDSRYWEPETSFPALSAIYTGDPRSGLPYGSVAFASTSTILCSIPRSNPAIYLRAQPYFPTNEVCNNNLKQIRFAKALWFRDQFPYNLDPRRMPQTSDLTNYLPKLRTLSCPVIGKPYFEVCYSPNAAGVNPSCGCPGENHLLEEP